MGVPVESWREGLTGKAVASHRSPLPNPQKISGSSGSSELLIWALMAVSSITELPLLVMKISGSPAARVAAVPNLVPILLPPLVNVVFAASSSSAVLFRMLLNTMCWLIGTVALLAKAPMDMAICPALFAPLNSGVGKAMLGSHCPKRPSTVSFARTPFQL